MLVAVNPAEAADFKAQFVSVCNSEVKAIKECECRHKVLNKPKNTDEEQLVLAVAKGNDAKVEALIRKAKSMRSVTIINSMTRGLMACDKFQGTERKWLN